MYSYIYISLVFVNMHLFVMLLAQYIWHVFKTNVHNCTQLVEVDTLCTQILTTLWYFMSVGAEWPDGFWQGRTNDRKDSVY